MLNSLFSPPALRRLRITHISLALAGLMWVLPFLYYYHQYPLTTFYQEWGTVMLGLAALLLLLNKHDWAAPEVPRIVLLPLGLIALVMLQFVLGRVVYFDQAMLFALYMLWLVLLMLLGQVLRKQLGWARMATVLAACLLLGSELNALSGVLQHYRWHTLLDSVITAKTGIAVFGNLAQPNHYANYITLGLISLGFLSKHLRIWQVVLLALPLLFVQVLSGSRSSWLYLLAMIAIAWFMQRKDKAHRGLLLYALCLLPAFALMHWLVQLPWLSGATGSVTTVQRMMSGETSGSIRLYLWHEAWLIVKQFPVLGAGWGQFAWQHFQLGPLLQDTRINGLYNNVHNLPLHVAVEMGLAGVLVLALTLGRWLWHGVRSVQERAHWWGYAALAVLGLHSMLEYPLWYAYFLGVAALLLGALDVQTYRLQLRIFGRTSIAVIVLLGLLSTVQLLQGYRLLERTIMLRPQYAGDIEYAAHIRQNLALVHAMPVLQPYAEIFLNNFIEISGDDLDAKLTLNERVLKFFPVNSVVYRRAWLLALAGHEAEAKLQVERAIWAYPRDWPAQHKVLQELAQKHPEKFSALLKFAIQKNEEYASAVSVK